MKEKMTAIFNAFEGYIGNQDVFDIVYSKKYGYVWVFPEDDFTEIFKTPDRMLERLCFSVIGDVIFSAENPDANCNSILTEYDKTESRRRLMEILSTIETEEKAAEVATYYLERYQERFKTR